MHHFMVELGSLGDGGQGYNLAQLEEVALPLRSVGVPTITSLRSIQSHHQESLPNTGGVARAI
jgi:hypothetical protein